MWKATRSTVIRLRDQQLQVSARNNMSKGQKECTNRGRDRVRFNSIQFHSKRMAFHLGYHSSPALLNYKKSYTHKNYTHTHKKPCPW